MALVKESAKGCGICHGMVFEQKRFGKIDSFVQNIGMGGEAIGFVEIPENGKFALVADGFQVECILNSFRICKEHFESKFVGVSGLAQVNDFRRNQDGIVDLKIKFKRLA
jgi:hypothetical protein